MCNLINTHTHSTYIEDEDGNELEDRNGGENGSENGDESR